MEFEAAALFGSQQDLEVVEVKAGPLRPDEVLVRIVSAGICHTDATVQHGAYPVPLPIVLGHEGSGIVEQVGTGIGDLAPGDPVTLTFMSCGRCAACSIQRPAHCTAFGPLNIAGTRGDGSTALSYAGQDIGGHFFGQSSFARYSIANRRNAVKVRPDAPLELIGPLGCGVQTGAGAILNSLKPAPGSSCIIFGAGSVGLSAVMAAKVAGCSPIVVVEPHVRRRALAHELGATIVIDPAEEVELAGRLVEATGGGMAIVETTGRASVVNTAISVLGRGGKLGLIGMTDVQATAGFNILELIGKGASIHGIIEGDSEPHSFIPYLIDLFMEGRFPVDKLVTFFDFADINEAMAAQSSGSVVKAVLRV